MRPPFSTQNNLNITSLSYLYPRSASALLLPQLTQKTPVATFDPTRRSEDRKMPYVGGVPCTFLVANSPTKYSPVIGFHNTKALLNIRKKSLKNCKNPFYRNLLFLRSGFHGRVLGSHMVLKQKHLRHNEAGRISRLETPS